MYRNLSMPLSSTHKIMHLHLKLKKYHMKHLQALTENDYVQRLAFCEWFLDMCDNNDNFLDNILWSDEAHFYLNGQLSTRNCVFWETSNPPHFSTAPLHSPKVTIWIGFNWHFIMPPFFFDGTVKGEDYLAMLRQHMVPNLPRRNRRYLTFMQDGAPPHIYSPVRSFLSVTFGNTKIISRMFPQQWPPRSPDLNPCDYWFWGTSNIMFTADSPLIWLN